MAADAVAQQYAEEGWTVVDDVIPLAEVEQLRAILEGGGPDGGPCHGINLTLKHPAFLALARDRRITDVTLEDYASNPPVACGVWIFSDQIAYVYRSSGEWHGLDRLGWLALSALSHRSRSMLLE